MAESSRKILKVSDCHHANMTPYQVTVSEDGDRKSAEVMYKCDTCKEWCRVVELLVEQK